MSLPKGKYMPISHTIPQQQRVPPNLANRGQTQQSPDEYSRQLGGYPQQASSFFFILGSEQHQALRQLAAGPVQSIANCNPHDMSKQPALSSPATPTPGLYQQAQGPGPRPGMPGPSPTQGALQPQQGQHITTRPISNIGLYYYPRPNTPRATHPMALTNPLSVGSAAPSTASQFPGIICAPPPIPFATSMPPQHLYVGAGPVPVSQYVQQRPQFGPSPQYAVTTSQQHVCLSSGTPPFMPNPPHQVYCSQMSIPVANVSRPPLQTMTQATANSFKKEKKIIRIQEPGTLRDVTEDIMSAGSSGYSSARGTSPVESGHSDNHIAAIFAAQVAAVANETSNKSLQLQNVPMGIEQQSSIMNTVIAEPQDSDSGIRLSSGDDFSEPSVIVDETGPANNRIEPSLEEISHKEEIERPLVTKEEIVSNAQVADSVEPLECVCDNSELLNDSHSTSIDTELCRYDNITNKIIDPNCELQKSENYIEFTSEINLPDKTNRNVIEREVIVKSQEVHHEEDINKIIPHQILENQQVIEQPQDLNISPQNGEIMVETTTVELKEVVEAKNKKNNKNKKRLKELNKKGESKEGGDMDAFLDREEEFPTVITSVPVISNLQYIETPNNEIDELKDEEIAKESLSAEDDDLEENEEAFEDSSEELISNAVNDHHSQITLKYNYTEDQWSPLNTEGKKKYDRSFLLQLQDDPLSLRKPSGLPELEVVKEKAIQHKLPEINRLPIMSLHARSHPDIFMPNYAARTGISRMPSGAPNRRQSQPCRDNRPKKVIAISTSLTQDVKLHECEKAWKPSHKKELTDDEEEQTQCGNDAICRANKLGLTGEREQDMQDLLKKTRGILNKLTPQKFQSLVEQVKNLAINTESRLNNIIDLVFEKAIDEPNFSVSYANMCKHLALMKVPVSGKDAKQQVNFRKLLLTKCQREFEKDVRDELKREERLKQINDAETEEKKKHMQEELEEEERTARRRSLGNIRFIGELFKLNMLTSSIMHDCVKKLIHQGDEDSLECLCRLLTTIGKELDTEKIKGGTKDLDCYFETMQKIVTERRTNSRVRFMLQDIIDLRARVWVPRRVENNPKTIDQIHREAEKEAHEQQLLLQHTTISKRSDDRERRKSRTGNAYTEEWTSVSKQSRNYGDPSKMRITKLPVEVENLQFCPTGRGFSNWGKGSSGGNKVTPLETESKTAGTNRYSALDQAPSSFDSSRGTQRAPASNRDSSRGRANQYVAATARKTPSPTSTSSKEREQLLATVKDFTKITSDEKQVNNQETAQSQERNDQALILRGEDISAEEMENKTKPLIDEFLHIRDFKEATQCFLEIASENSVPYFIMAAVNQVLERSNQARNMVGEFLHDLVCKKIITVEQYIKGFTPILEMAEDSAIDIPRIWEYLGEIIAPMVQDGSVCLTFLKDLAAPCIASRTAGKLVAHILQAAAKGNKVGELWRASGLQWSDFLDPNEDVRKFIQDNNLEFTVHTEAEHAPALSIAEIKKELEFLLQKKCVNNEVVFDWIEANVGDQRTKEPQFIRVLVTTVMENAIDGHDHLIENKVLDRVPLLQKYLDHDEHLELQAVYALQALMNQLSHPKDVLRHIFDFLYDEDLISEDAFNQWEQSTDAAEQEGKGVALKSVASFFSWLKQDGEEYSEEN